MTSAAEGGRSKFRAWRLAARPPTLWAAVGPVLTGWGVAWGIDGFRIGPALAALVGALLLQVGANLANDLFDFRRGVDTAERLGPPRAAQLGLLSERELAVGTAVVLGAALLLGVYLVYEGGWPIVALGLAAIVAAVAYTGGPFPYGYRALGDLFVFLFFGPAAVVGTVWVQAGEAPLLAWLASLPLGALVTAILVVNNLRDRELDARAGKVTLAVLLGDRATRRWYGLLILAAYAMPVLLWATGVASPWVGLSYGSLPFARRPVQMVARGTTGRALNGVLRDAARLAALFGALLGLGLALGSA